MAHAELVWTDTRMTNWYRNEHGRVVAVMPWRIVDYYAMTRCVQPEQFVWGGAPAGRTRPDPARRDEQEPTMTELPEIFRSPLGRATIGDQLRRHALNIPRATRSSPSARTAPGVR